MKKLYEEADIQGIADAIRSKNGTTNTYKTSQMKSAIEDIPSGSSVIYHPADFTFTELDVVDGKVDMSHLMFDRKFRIWGLFTDGANELIEEFDVGLYLKDRTPDSEHFDEAFDQLFRNCSNLSTLKYTGLAGKGLEFDVSRYSTGGGVGETFSNCSSLEYIDLFNYVTLKNITGWDRTFSGCTSLKEIDISGYLAPMKKPEAAYQRIYYNSTFYSCSSLKSIDMSDPFGDGTLADVRGFTSVFVNCPNVQTLNMACISLANIEMFDIAGSFANVPRTCSITVGDQATADKLSPLGFTNVRVS